MRGPAKRGGRTSSRVRSPAARRAKVPPSEWDEMTPRSEWRELSRRTAKASEVLGRIMHTHEAAVQQRLGPKQYLSDTDEEEATAAGDQGDVTLGGADESVMVVTTEDPSKIETLITLSRSSSCNVLYEPARPPTPPASEDEAPSTEEEEEEDPEDPEDLQELARENKVLQEAVATALRKERQRDVRRAERKTLRQLERIYASDEPELEPEPQLPASATSAALLHTKLAHAGEMGARLKAANAHVGHVTCSLMWANTDDLDLHCESEAGGHISWNNKKGKCGGHLDVDMNASDHRVKEEPVENIVWYEPPPAGKYRIWVENNTARNDGPTPFVVRLTMDGHSQEKQFPDVRELESIDVFTFERAQTELQGPRDASNDSTHDIQHNDSSVSHLLSTLKEQERVIQEQKDEIQKLRQENSAIRSQAQEAVSQAEARASAAEATALELQGAAHELAKKAMDSSTATLEAVEQASAEARRVVAAEHNLAAKEAREASAMRELDGAKQAHTAAKAPPPPVKRKLPPPIKK